MLSLSPARAARRSWTSPAAPFAPGSQQPLDQPAVHLQRGASDVGGRVRQQEGTDASEFIRIAVAPQRDRAAHQPLFFRERVAGLPRVILVELREPIGGDAS